MIRFLNRRHKMFIGTVYVMIYCMVGFPIFTAVDVNAAEPAATSMTRVQLPSFPTSTSFRTAQVFSEVLEKTPPAEEPVKLSEKEKKKLVEQGVAQYEKGERDEAKKTLEHAKAVFPSNYAVPYYLGLIYLEEGRRSDAIVEWKQYVLMDPKSEDAMKIRKYLTLLIREEAVEYAKQALANEAALLSGPVADNTVAVTVFENLGSENLGPLGKGMSAMLIHDLSQVPDLQVVERVKLQALLQEMNLGTSGLVDQKTTPKVGKLLKAKHVTTGNLADIQEEKLQIVSVLVDAERTDRIDTQEVQGAMKRFYDLEKEIACSIVKDLGRDCDKLPGAFGKIHTKNLAALTAFSVGLDYLDQEKYDEAREAFQKALEEDPEFDLAEEALLSTPLTAMLLMTPSQMILSASACSFSTSAVGSAAVGGAGGGGVGVVGITGGVLLGGAAIAGLAAGGGGGGGDGSPPPPPAPLNLTGAWVGTWTDPSGTNSGQISLNLTQAEGSSSLSGTASITGSSCISTGTLSGTITGNTLASVIQGTGTASFNANCTSTSMNGTLEFTSGDCVGVTGNVTISQTGSATISW